MTDLTTLLDEPIDVITATLFSRDTPVDAAVVRFFASQVTRATRSATLEQLAAAATTTAMAARRSTDSDHRARLETLADVLLAAVERRDASAVPALMRSFSGKAKHALAALTAATQRHATTELATGWLWQAELAAQLEVSTSNMSHLVAELRRASVVVTRRQGTRSMVSLSDSGKQYVREHHPDLAADLRDDTTALPARSVQKRAAPRPFESEQLNSRLVPIRGEHPAVLLGARRTG